MSKSSATFAQTAVEACARCHAALTENQEICPSCEQPTKFMSFKSRAEYEVEQWKRYKAQPSAKA